MSRLLFAAARGARIQKWGSTIRKWFEVTDMHLIDEADGDRTHPDDEHLQYGPISTEFRTLAKNPPPSTSGGGPVVKEYINTYKFSDEVYMFMQDADKSLFLLLISEVLADEGL
jgi:hypothetical protein